MKGVKAWFETVESNPDKKAARRTIPLIKEGIWDGEKFTSYDEKGLSTVVRKEEWIIFECQSCDSMGSTYLHTCPLASEIHSDFTECNCCERCTNECNDSL